MPLVDYANPTRFLGLAARAMPWLMRGLSIAGTAAMFLVGGGILVHSIPALHHLIQPYTHGGWGVLWENLFNAGVGVVAGAVILAVVTAVQRLRGKRHAA